MVSAPRPSTPRRVPRACVRCSIVLPGARPDASAPRSDEAGRRPVDGGRLVTTARGRRSSSKAVRASARYLAESVLGLWSLIRRAAGSSSTRQSDYRSTLRRRQRVSSELRQRRDAPEHGALVDAFARGRSQSAGTSSGSTATSAEPAADSPSSARSSRARRSRGTSSRRGPHRTSTPATRWTSRCATSSPAFHARPRESRSLPRVRVAARARRPRPRATSGG